jgi:hypothetical protein
LEFLWSLTRDAAAATHFFCHALHATADSTLQAQQVALPTAPMVPTPTR